MIGWVDWNALIVWLLCFTFELILVWVHSAGVLQLVLSLLDPALGGGCTVDWWIDRRGFAAERCKLKQFSAEWRRDDRRSGGANSSGFLIINWNWERGRANHRDEKRERHKGMENDFFSFDTYRSRCFCNIRLSTACCLYEFVKAERVCSRSRCLSLRALLKSGSHITVKQLHLFFKTTLHIFMKLQPVCTSLCLFCSFKQATEVHQIIERVCWWGGGEKGEEREVESHLCHSETIPIRPLGRVGANAGPQFSALHPAGHTPPAGRDTHLIKLSHLNFY